MTDFRDEIAGLLHRLCTAMDACDEDGIKACFHLDEQPRTPDATGPRTFCRDAIATLRSLDGTSHRITSIEIERDGSDARAKSRFVSLSSRSSAPLPPMHRAAAGKAPDPVVATGYYLDDLRYIDHRWALVGRILVGDHESTAACEAAEGRRPVGATRRDLRPR